ncbi:MAG: hypothetical protein K0S00_664 [Xanthobacteraceae bacterium]|jgi:hypothetical protein|nr:hypothetical protein [Xanthobacteraceae bacterium]
MKKVVIAVFGVAAVLVGFAALPFLTVADATTGTLYGPARPQGYQTCFMERRAVFTDGAPRMVRERRCVFAE